MYRVSSLKPLPTLMVLMIETWSKWVQGHRLLGYGNRKYLPKTGLNFLSIFVYDPQEKVGSVYTAEKPIDVS